MIESEFEECHSFLLEKDDLQYNGRPGQSLDRVVTLLSPGTAFQNLCPGGLLRFPAPGQLSQWEL